MTQIWLYSLISVFAVSLVSLIGVFFISVDMKKLKKVLLFLVSFAAGSLLGDAFIHLLPKAFSQAKSETMVPFLILAGIIIFFVLEKILYWRHCHIPTSEEHPHPLAINNLVGDGMHNFLDGVIIAASYLVSIPIGIATTMAVFMHEIPQEIGDFGILLHAGFSRKKALFFNFLSATMAILGAVLTISIGLSVASAQEFLVPLSIGGFVYIATADLIPELKKETDFRKSWFQLLSLLLGMGVMAALLLVE